MKKFAAFDIDGTLFRSGLYREVVYELLASGKAPTELRQSFDSYEAGWKRRSHSDAFVQYQHAMAVAFDDAIPSIRYQDFEQAAETVVQRLKDYVYVYTRDLITSLKDSGYTLVAISGSQEELVSRFAKIYGFDIWVGQYYERGRDGFFTGNITKTHEGKDKIIKRLVSEHDLTLGGSLAIGDTAGDIGMLQSVENPIAFNPDEQLFKVAQQNGWKVIVERKNMIYELEANGSSYVLA